MDFLISIATAADRLDPAVTALLDRFRDERLPLHLALGIIAAAVVLLAVLLAWGAIAWVRIHRQRWLVRSFGTPAAFHQNFARVDRSLSASVFGNAWAEYRKCLKPGDAGILYLRPPQEYLGLHAIDSRSFPARFFAAAHGYFIGVGLLLTFVGLVAALKFAAAGVASSDLAVAKDALNALLAAASFKFMTSIAGLGSSILLAVSTRSMTYLIEAAALGLAADLERAMEPVFAESLAYDQLAATRAQLRQLETIGATLSAPVAARAAGAGTEAINADALQQIVTAFLAEMRGAADTEIKQVANQLSDVGNAIGLMQNHIGRSGDRFADQIGLAAARLLTAATALQESVDGRIDRVGARIDALGTVFARGEALFAGAAEKAAGTLLGRFEEFDASLRSQIGSMKDIVVSLDRTRQVLDTSAATWLQSAAPVLASVDASRQMTVELGQVADRVGAAQRDMAEMAKAVGRLSESVGTVWDNYRSRFEKVDDELQAVFERLQGGTRAFGDEIMDFVGKLDASLVTGMQAFSLGTEELREVARMLVVNGDAKAAA